MNAMQKARAQMLIHHMFFGSLAMSTEMLPVTNIPTAATDMKKIFYNEKFLASLGDPKLVIFVLIHELMHIMLMHGLRLGGRNCKLWNIACDHAINLQIKTMGHPVWEHAYCDDRFKGMSAEAIYDTLRQENEDAAKNGRPQPHGADGDGTPMDGDLMEPGDMDAAERAEVEQTIRQGIANAASMARMAGQLPAHLARMIDGIISPPLPWQELLRKFATNTVNDDESWRRRNRRFADVYLPTRHSERLGEIVVIGDTSGSMDNKFFAQVGEEISSIVEFCKPERTRVVWADDTDCELEEVFEPGEQVILHPKGGGGTDMRKPLKYAEQFNPQVVILITDGYTPWPKEEPPFPLIVCINNEVSTCPVGDVVRIVN